ncbi:MAG: hypothetical protein J6A96_05545 [Clostridia bacterium]|nr:hypothetical protein [Clostridia bacterium]
MKLSTLFYNLTHIAYTHGENGLDYATRRSNDTLYIYFQDSDGAVDWKNNLDFPIKCYGNLFAHRGFLRVWESAKDCLSEQILDTGLKKIVVSGYSHGAALAVLCHEFIWYHRPDLRDTIEGYGFGCPRVIWGIKNAYHEERWAHFNVIKNIDDIITHLPPAFLGYFHVGNMIKIGKRGNYSTVDAHRPESYMKELFKAEM